jgi:hypothetical protein
MGATAVSPSILRRRLCVRVGSFLLRPRLTVPNEAHAVVLVATTSDDAAHQRANRVVAAALWAAGFATLETDLLIGAEDAETFEFRFDSDFVAGQVRAVLESARCIPSLQNLEAGVFVARSCATGALTLAAKRSGPVRSVVANGCERLDRAQDICRVAETTVKWFHRTLGQDRGGGSALGGARTLWLCGDEPM